MVSLKFTSQLSSGHKLIRPTGLLLHDVPRKSTVIRQNDAVSPPGSTLYVNMALKIEVASVFVGDLVIHSKTAPGTGVLVLIISVHCG